VNSFVEQVKMLINNPDLRAEKGEGARARVKEDFSWDVSAEKIHALYRSCFKE